MRTVVTFIRKISGLRILNATQKNQNCRIFDFINEECATARDTQELNKWSAIRAKCINNVCVKRKLIKSIAHYTRHQIIYKDKI